MVGRATSSAWNLLGGKTPDTADCHISDRSRGVHHMNAYQGGTRVAGGTGIQGVPWTDRTSDCHWEYSVAP